MKNKTGDGRNVIWHNAYCMQMSKGLCSAVYKWWRQGKNDPDNDKGWY